MRILVVTGRVSYINGDGYRRTLAGHRVDRRVPTEQRRTFGDADQSETGCGRARVVRVRNESLAVVADRQHNPSVRALHRTLASVAAECLMTLLTLSCATR